MKTVTTALLVLSVIETILWMIPVPNETLWVVRMIARELWPWFIILNTLGLLLAIFWRRWFVPVFAFGLALMIWQLTQIAPLEHRMAQQWTLQGFSSAELRAPSAIELFRTSLFGPAIPDIQPNALRPDVYLYKSPESVAEEPLPILIDIHGGSWQHGYAGSDDMFCRYMAAQGYAVFSIDYRKAPEFQYPIQIQDVRGAISWIYRNAPLYGADATRIALVGRSAGAELALVDAYTSMKIPIGAVISYYGPTDLVKGYNAPPKPDPIDIRAKLSDYLGGGPQSAPDAYRDASPTSHVRKGLPPTLLIQGDEDHVVKPRFARELRQDLLSKGDRILLLDIPWSEHAFDVVYFGPGSVLALAYVEAFLRDALPKSSQPVLE
ncbi:MAG TPA: alpha/beta hydrolase [Alphaproteobacteria bacterium]|nr:alpha/beta hydrolase [Alphaproteobacteria bacterium]